MWHPDTTEQCDEMHYGPNKHNMKRNDLIRIFEESFKLLMILPLISDISNQLQIVSRWFNLILCCSGAISRCVVLIKELRWVKNRGGLLSLLQPNQSDCAEPPSERTGHFYSPDISGSLYACLHTQAAKGLFWQCLFLHTRDKSKKYKS